MTETPGPVTGPAHPRPDASVGQRVGALLLDSLLVMLPLFVLAAVLFGERETTQGRTGFTLGGLPLLLTALVALAYFFVLELATGQTLGKKMVGTRVVSTRGGSPGAGQVLVRTLMRVVDGFAFYLVGFVAALASRRNQRLGDMAASTRVERTR